MAFSEIICDLNNGITLPLVPKTLPPPNTHKFSICDVIMTSVDDHFFLNRL